MRDSDSSKLRPIDAFVKYFLDVKPYHTKLLEVVERYKFAETMTVDITDTMFMDVAYRNNPLCRAVGFGLVYDECGFSNDNCCDLFQCLGGYGLIWDNSDLVASYPISGIDYEKDEIIVDGNYTADRRLEILRSSGNQVVLRGDQTAHFLTHKLFLIAPFNVYQLVSVSGNVVTVQGDVATELQYKKEFRVSGTANANGLYGVSTAYYNTVDGVTEITVAGNYDLSGDVTGGYIETESQPKNQGFYAVASAELDDGNTIVTVSENTPLPVQTSVNNGSVQLRTALIAPRHVWLSGVSSVIVAPASASQFGVASEASSVEREYRIADAWYDVDANQTRFILAEQLVQDELYNEVRMYGYMTNAGFDNEEECDQPKPTNVHTLFGESLFIRVIPVVAPNITPTPTPSCTNFILGVSPKQTVITSNPTYFWTFDDMTNSEDVNNSGNIALVDAINGASITSGGLLKTSYKRIGDGFSVATYPDYSANNSIGSITDFNGNSISLSGTDYTVAYWSWGIYNASTLLDVAGYYVQLNYSGGGNGTVIINNTSFPVTGVFNKTWNHIGVSVKRPASNTVDVSVVVNGILLANKSYTSGSPDWVNFLVPNGYIDDYAIYRRALSHCELREQYEAGIAAAVDNDADMYAPYAIANVDDNYSWEFQNPQLMAENGRLALQRNDAANIVNVYRRLATTPTTYEFVQALTCGASGNVAICSSGATIFAGGYIYNRDSGLDTFTQVGTGWSSVESVSADGNTIVYTTSSGFPSNYSLQIGTRSNPATGTFALQTISGSGGTYYKPILSGDGNTIVTQGKVLRRSGNTFTATSESMYNAAAERGLTEPGVGRDTAKVVTHDGTYVFDVKAFDLKFKDPAGITNSDVILDRSYFIQVKKWNGTTWDIVDRIYDPFPVVRGGPTSGTQLFISESRYGFGTIDDYFGRVIDISQDGSRLAVFQNHTPQLGPLSASSIMIFDKHATLDRWEFKKVLYPAIKDYYGNSTTYNPDTFKNYSLELSKDGRVLSMTAPYSGPIVDDLVTKYTTTSPTPVHLYFDLEAVGSEPSIYGGDDYQAVILSESINEIDGGYYSAPKNYWRTVSGSILTDTIGTNHGTASGPVASAAGIAGASTAFLFTDPAYITLANPIVVDKAFTLEFWMRATSATDSVLFSSATGDLKLKMLANGKLMVIDSTTLQANQIPTVSKIGFNEWTHVAITSFARNMCVIYINGRFAGYANFDYSSGFKGFKVIGANFDGSLPFSGSISEVVYYNYALMPYTVFKHYKNRIYANAMTPTPALSGTPTPTPTPTISVTPTITPTISITPTVTPTISVTPTPTPTISITPTITPTISVTPSITPSTTPTPTPSRSFGSVAPDPYGEAVLADTPTHFWRFNNVGGTTVPDEVGTNTLTIVDESAAGNVTIVGGQPFGDGAGHINADWGWDTIRGFQMANALTNLASLSNGMTAEGWMYFEPPGAGQEFYATLIGGSNSNRGSEIWVSEGSSTMDIYWYGGTGSTTVPVILNQWFHVAFVCAPDSSLKVYINGSRVDSGSLTWATGFDLGYVGGDGGSESTNGYIDEVAYYTYQLSDAEISAHYTAGVGLVPVPLTTLDPATADASLVLSNGNLTATESSGVSNSNARATTSKSSGKWYWEGVVESVNASGWFDVGMVQDSDIIHTPNYISQNGNGFTVESGIGYGDLEPHSSVGWGSWPSADPAVGGVLQLAVDLDTKKFWAKWSSQSTWNGGTGDPALGTGGYSFTGTAPFRPAIDLKLWSMTMRFKASSMTGTIPAGFTAWDG